MDEDGGFEYVRVCREHHLELVEMNRRRNDVLVCPCPEGEHPAMRVMPPSRPGGDATARTSYEIWVRRGGVLVERYAQVEGAHVDYDDKRVDPDRKLGGRDLEGMSDTPERPDRRRRFGLLAVAALTVVMGAGASAAGADQSGDAIVRVEGGAQAVLSGRAAGAAYKANLYLSADVGVHVDSVGDDPIMRGTADLELIAKPGREANAGDVETFQAAQVTLGGWRIIGGKDLALAVGAEWGYGVRLNEQGAIPEDRLAMKYGGGFKLYSRKSGAGFKLMYGRDKFVGPRGGWGQLMPSLSLPVPGADGIVMVRVQSSLDLAPAPVVPLLGVKQLDYHTVAVTIDTAKLLDRLRAPRSVPSGGSGTWTSRNR